MSKIAAIIGRILIALIFVVSGLGKLMDVSGTAAMIAGVGLPSSLAIPTGLFELIAGLCLASGFMVRLVSVLLAGFSALAILFFHSQLGDPLQRVMLLKDLAIIGGLALAFAHSQMWGHYYAITRQRRGELEARDADERVHEAELRAARAEAAAEVLEYDRKQAAEPGRPVVTYNHGQPFAPALPGRRWFDW